MGVTSQGAISGRISGRYALLTWKLNGAERLGFELRMSSSPMSGSFSKTIPPGSDLSFIDFAYPQAYPHVGIPTCFV